MGTVRIRILFLAFFPLSIWATKLQYEINFLGLENAALLQDLKNSSDLVSLKDRPPASVNGLQYRTQADIPKLLQILKAYAYYDARITYEIRVENDIFYVDLFIHPGPAYRLRSYEVFHGDCLDSSPLPRCSSLCFKDVGLKAEQIADSTSIVNAEIAALTQLANCGYPLAHIDKRRVIVDMAEKKVDAAVCIQEGPLCRFGPITYFGLKNVNPRFIDRKITWKEGEIFNLDLIDKTQNRLLKSDLFSSVLISHAEELDQSGELSMKIRLSEAKHRSVSLGFFYATVDGPGGTFCWIHRNLRGMGEYLGFESNVSKRFIDGSATYRKPDFFHVDQTFTALAKASRENIVPYRAYTYLESNRIERQINSRASVSAGLSGQYISVHKSVNNGHFFVLGLPLFAEYSTADSPLDPTKGLMISYLATPYQSLNKSNIHYVKQKLTGNFYIPLTEERKVVLALHA
jgi:translocation and assembly module TamA